MLDRGLGPRIRSRCRDFGKGTARRRMPDQRATLALDHVAAFAARCGGTPRRTRGEEIRGRVVVDVSREAGEGVYVLA